ncbi:MAG: hypothetical protein C4337_08970 [Armatimonadota bacterium]
MTRRERTLLGLLVAVVLIALLALIRSQPWGRIDIRPIKPSTVNWIICVQLNEQGYGDLLMLQPDGRSFFLTHDEYDDQSPNWAPDGKKIVFSSNRRDQVYQLWTIDPDGNGLMPLTIGGGAKQAPIYDKDGQYILHIAQGLVTEVDAKATRATQLIPLATQMTQVREQFGQVAFRYARRYNETLIAAVQRIDEGEQAVIQDLSLGQQQFTLPVLIAGERVDIDWSPRKPWLVVSGIAVPLPASQQQLQPMGALVRFDFTSGIKEPEVRPLWLDPTDKQGAIEVAWSPDGSRIAFVLCERKLDGTLVRKGLYTVPEEGGAITEIVAGEVYEPSWSPDGQQLVFAMGKAGARQIYTVRVDGTELKQRTPSGDHLSPRWSPAQP